MKKYDEDLKSFFNKVYGEKLHKFSKDDSPEMRMKPSWYMYQLLCEAYTRSGEYTDWIDVVRSIRDFYSGKTSQQDFVSYLKEHNIGLVPADGSNKFGAYFNTTTRQIVMRMSSDVFQRILNADEDELKNLAYTFWVSFVHEDTHRQQQKSAGDYNIHTNYKDAKLLSWEDDYEKDIEYFDQYLEAAANGREIGALLSDLYPGESASTIFTFINANKVKNDYCRKTINIYKHPGMSDRNRRKFFRALYDFLAGNEKDEEEQSSSQ